MLSCQAGNDGPNVCAASETDLLDRWRRNQRVGDPDGILTRSMVDGIQTSCRQACLVENGSDGPESRGRELWAFEDNGVAASKRLQTGSEAKDVRSVPVRQRVSTRGPGTARSALTTAQCPAQHHKALCKPVHSTPRQPRSVPCLG